eukprot:XP_019926768.1 PREDICTED: C-type lectin domain family 17, member A [Crassostrea gigas]
MISRIRIHVYVRLSFKSVAWFYSTVGFLGFERSIWFHKALINGSQLSSLQNHLHLETASLSENHCAYRCLENQVCISFIDHESSGTCQLFGLGVDIRSKTSSGTITAYTKQVTCEDFGYVSLNSTKKCLKHHHVPLSWMDANNTCVSEGGNLFSITSLDMMEEVLNITFDKDSSFMLIHVDGNDLWREGNWSYHDGSSVSFSPLFWRPTEPNGGMNENCLGLLNGTLCDINCWLSAKFVCERYFFI